MNCELIKVCGMRDADNIRTLDLLGIANWMGFIFYPASSRYVEAVPEYMPRHSRRVGVFVNATIEDIIAHCADYSLNAVQLHGDETPDYCSELRQQLPTGTAIIKAISVSSEEDLQRTTDYTSTVDYFLFETPCSTYGGSGEKFQWELLNAYTGTRPFLLSGGIGPDDIDAIIRFRHPKLLGIDLNSRFEISPALKDTNRLMHFITTLKSKES